MGYVLHNIHFEGRPHEISSKSKQPSCFRKFENTVREHVTVNWKRPITHATMDREN